MLSVVMLNVDMVSVMLSLVMLNVIILGVITLCVEAPYFSACRLISLIHRWDEEGQYYKHFYDDRK